jgi:large subunit ribosomal protein L18
MSLNGRKRLKGKARRHRRVRKKVVGTGERPRLCVYRSLKHIYAQLIDDGTSRCLLTVSSLSEDVKKEMALAKEAKGKTEVSTAVGKIIAEKAKATGIEKVTFDRGGYLYHGRVRALADGAREAGLKF